MSPYISYDTYHTAYWLLEFWGAKVRLVTLSDRLPFTLLIISSFLLYACVPLMYQRVSYWVNEVAATLESTEILHLAGSAVCGRSAIISDPRSNTRYIPVNCISMFPRYAYVLPAQ